MGVHSSCPRSIPTLGSETVQIASTRSCLPSFAVNQIVATLAALSADMGLIVLTKETDAVNADVQKKRGWLQAASAGVLAMVLMRNGTPAMTWQMVFSRLTAAPQAPIDHQKQVVIAVSSASSRAREPNSPTVFNR